MIHSANAPSSGGGTSWIASGRRRKSLFAIVVWLAAMCLAWKLTFNVYIFAVNIVLAYLSVWALYFYFSALSIQEMVKRFLLANFSILITLACFEVFVLLHIMDYGMVFHTPIVAKQFDPHYLLDHELVFIRKPYDHASGISRGGDITFLFDTSPVELYPFDVRYDQHGFRNSTDLTSADIAFIGDSFVEGDFVPYDKIATSLLARMRNSRVANLGQIGYGPQPELVVLKRYALPLHVKVIFWLFFEGNDLDDVIYYDKVTANWDASAASFHSFLNRSFSKNAFLAIDRLVGDPRRSGRPRSGWIRTPSGERKRMYFLYPGLRLEGAKLGALEKTYTILANAQAVCNANHIDLVVVFVPTKTRVYRGLAEFDQDSIVPQWPQNDMLERIRAALADRSPETSYIDLTPSLISAAKKGELQYLLQDSHLSPAGHRTAAQAVDDFLTQREAQRTAKTARTH